MARTRVRDGTRKQPSRRALGKNVGWSSYGVGQTWEKEAAPAEPSPRSRGSDSRRQRSARSAPRRHRLRSGGRLATSWSRPLLSGLEDDAEDLIHVQRLEKNSEDAEPLGEHVDRWIPKPRDQDGGRHQGKLAHGIQYAKSG